MCDGELAWEISKCSEGTGRPVARNDSETRVMPTELSTTNQNPPTDERAQGDLLRDYEQMFANLPVHVKIDQTVLQCRSREYCSERTVPYDT